MVRVVYAKFETHVREGVQIHADEAWDATDPLVLEHPDWFTSEPSIIRRSVNSVDASTFGKGSSKVEAATAEPGEIRKPTITRTVGK
jgi:hypothetical protein